VDHSPALCGQGGRDEPAMALPGKTLTAKDGGWHLFGQGCQFFNSFAEDFGSGVGFVAPGPVAAQLISKKVVGNAVCGKLRG